MCIAYNLIRLVHLSVAEGVAIEFKGGGSRLPKNRLSLPELLERSRNEFPGWAKSKYLIRDNSVGDR